MKTRPRGRTGVLLRSWRELRGLSQLELATMADTSARNLSFIENGRSVPNEELLGRLCETLAIDATGRELLRHSAGFGTGYSPLDLGESDMAWLMATLERMLRRMEPCPAMAIDRQTKLLACNETAVRALHWLAHDTALYQAGTTNVSELALSPDGLKPYLTNWAEVGRRILDRLYREAAIDDADGAMTELYERYLSIDDIPPSWHEPPTESSDPLLRFSFEKEGRKLEFDSLVLTIGTPADPSFQGVRLRYWLPADEATHRFLVEVRGEEEA